MNFKAIAILLCLFFLLPDAYAEIPSYGVQILNPQAIASSFQSTCFAGLASPIGIGNLSAGGEGQIIQTTGGNVVWGSAGAGSVTSIAQGLGITATPNPITGSGSIALNTSYTDSKYVNRSVWTTIDNYPAACGGGQAVTGLGDTLTCNSFLTSYTETDSIALANISSNMARWVTTENDTYHNYVLNNISNLSIYWSGYTSPPSSWTSTFNSTYDNYVTNNYSAKTDFVNNATERTLFLSTYNATYAAKPDTTYNSTYHTYVFNNLSNSSMYWDNLDSPLASWLDTFNITYHNYVFNNISAKTDYVNNATERSLFIGAFNQSYHDFWLSNISAKTDYVNNATERTLFLSTYNSTYAAKPDTTFNQSYHDVWTSNTSARAFYISNTTERSLFTDTFNLSYHNSWLSNISAGTFRMWNLTERSLFTDTFNSSYNAFMLDNYSAKTDHLNNATEAALYTATYNASYHGLWAANRTSTANSSSYWDNLDTPASITGIGTQAQNLNMNNYNVTGVQCIVFNNGGSWCSA